MTVNVLRWILVVPAAVIGLVLGALLNALGTFVAVFLIGLPNSGGWGIVLTILFISPLLGFIFGCFGGAGAVPVVASTWLAPAHRGVVSTVVATLVIAAILVGTFSNIANGATWWSALIVAVANSVGAVYGAVQMRDSRVGAEAVPAVTG